MEEQILASQELSSFLLSERTLLDLNLTKTGAAEIFLLFRDNDNFTSYNNNYGLRRGSQPRLFPSQSRSC